MTSRSHSLSRNIKKSRKGFTLVEVMIVIVIIGILFNIAVPNLVRAREQTRVKSCVQNLKRIDSAKQQWAITNKKSASATPLSTDLYGTNLYLKGQLPTCPTGSVYTINNIDSDPTCSLGSSFPPYIHTLSGQ